VAVAPTADCEKLRDERQALLRELETLEGAMRAAGPAQKASHAIADLSDCLRSSGDKAKKRSTSSDRVLQAANLLATAIAELVESARSPAKGALTETDRAQQSLGRVNVALDRLASVLAVAEGSVSARLEGLRAFLAEVRSALADLTALPGAAPAVEGMDRALEVMISWSERVAAARDRAGELTKLLPAMGLGLPSFSGHDENQAQVGRVRRTLAQLDHDLLKCGDRPPGPECVECGKSNIDDAIGRAFGDLATKAKQDLLHRAGASADLVTCRTALRELQSLDGRIADVRLARLEADLAGEVRRTRELDDDLNALLAQRRRLREAFPRIVHRYRNAAKGFKDAAFAWRDEASNRLGSIAKEERWSPAAIRHVQSCHADLNDPKLRALLSHSPAKALVARKKLLLAVPVVVAVLLLLAMVAGAIGGDDPTSKKGGGASDSSARADGAELSYFDGTWKFELASAELSYATGEYVGAILELSADGIDITTTKHYEIGPGGSKLVEGPLGGHDRLRVPLAGTLVPIECGTRECVLRTGFPYAITRGDKGFVMQSPYERAGGAAAAPPCGAPDGGDGPIEIVSANTFRFQQSEAGGHGDPCTHDAYQVQWKMTATRQL
jgi:hypothetical protein